MYVKFLVTKLNALSLKLSRNNQARTACEGRRYHRRLVGITRGQDLKSVCCKSTFLTRYATLSIFCISDIIKNVQTRDIFLFLRVFPTSTTECQSSLFFFFLSNKAQCSMESAWQRVESMHRWILENGGMIFFPCYKHDLFFTLYFTVLSAQRNVTS